MTNKGTVRFVEQVNRRVQRKLQIKDIVADLLTLKEILSPYCTNVQSIAAFFFLSSQFRLYK